MTKSPVRSLPSSSDDRRNPPALLFASQGGRRLFTFSFSIGAGSHDPAKGFLVRPDVDDRVAFRLRALNAARFFSLKRKSKNESSR
jgi:hypothetical protein